MQSLSAPRAVLAVLLLTATACTTPVERLNVWVMEGGHHDPAAFFEEAAADYAGRTGVGLDLEYVPWSEARDRLAAAAQEGTLPDVAELGTTWTPEFASAGALLDLTDHLDDPRRYILMEVFATQLDEAAATHPIAPEYAEVQERRVLQRMVRDVLTGRAGVDEATAAAAQELEEILNEN